MWKEGVLEIMYEVTLLCYNEIHTQTCKSCRKYEKIEALNRQRLHKI